jgi:hypothetical protein
LLRRGAIVILREAQDIFERLLAPLPLDTFLDQALDKRFVKLDAAGQEHRRDLLLGADPVHALTSAWETLAANISSHSADPIGPPPKAEVVEGPKAFRAKISEFHARRYTVRVPDVRALTPELNTLIRALEFCFQQPVGVHGFWSAAGAKAPVHHDEYDLFAIQLIGRKRWFVSTGRSELPNAWPHAPDGPERLGEYAVLEMSPGDLLYLPRGTTHRTESISDSIHLSIGFIPLTLREALIACLDHLSDVERSLRECVGERIAEQLRAGSLGDIPARIRSGIELLAQHTAADAFITDALQRRSSRTIGKLNRVLTPIGPPVLEPRMRMRHAPLAICHIMPSGNRVDFAYPGGHHYVHVGAHESVNFIADTPEFGIRDIPGNIGDDVRLALVKKLMDSGFLEIAA